MLVSVQFKWSISLTFHLQFLDQPLLGLSRCGEVISRAFCCCYRKKGQKIRFLGRWKDIIHKIVLDIMGQRSMPYSNHIVDLGADQRSQAYIRPEPSVLYGSYTAFPHNVHTIAPAEGGVGNFYWPNIPYHQEGAFYGMSPANQIQQWRPLTNVGSSTYCNPVAAPSASMDIPAPVNHGLHDQLPFSGTHGIVGNNTDNDSSKEKNVEGSGSAGSSTSIVPVIPTAQESDASLNVSESRDHGGNDSASILEDGVQRSRSRSASGPDSALQNNNNRVLQGNYVGQAYQFPGNPWLNLPINSSVNEAQYWVWNQAAPLPYLPGGAGGYVLDAGYMGMQGYQVNSSNGGLTSFMRPPIHQGPPHRHHLPPNMQFMGGHTMSFSPQMTTSPGRHLQNSSTNSTNNPFQGVVGGGSRYIRPFYPTGFRLYRPHPRLRGTNTRHHNFPNGVAIRVPGYHGVGEAVDQHRDMRLDIDHMSYEELLALEERIGKVTIGLSEEAIDTNLKTRIFLSTETPGALESVECQDHKTDFCVICQMDYNDQEKIGILECGHEYHGECIKKWLVLKNTCPICKSTALLTKEKDVVVDGGATNE